ncbi:BTB/POZ domain-containing protein KCTD11 isoform C [Alligator mississippiensis]|uniref:BTB/POZ domain-containing protein KCTD11 isoform C n=1 Tax=Alligator mississippiensis TaxID=8496 RepID=A0A151NJQ8_ALLMI|nr:BTB/POZ domain-containing protein KCTD11 isoform C [Alligator mississippiensis]
MGLVEPDTPGVRGQPEVDETPLTAENPGVQDGEPQIPCSARLGGPEIPSVRGTETRRPPSTRLVGLENPGVHGGEAQRPSSIGLVGPENLTIWGQPGVDETPQTGENPSIQDGEPQRSQSPQLVGPENPGVQGREACIPPSTMLAGPENLDVRVPWAGGGPVTLNVGGKLYTTTVETLTRCPDSMLAAMFRGGPRPSHMDGRGHYIIDRDGPTFRHVLNFLRTGQLQLPEGYSELGLLATEADFYQLHPLQEALSQWDAVQRRLGSAAVLHTDVDTQQRVVHFTPVEWKQLSTGVLPCLEPEDPPPMGEEGAGPERSQAPPPEDLKDFPPPPTGAGQDYDTRRLGGRRGLAGRFARLCTRYEAGREGRACSKYPWVGQTLRDFALEDQAVEVVTEKIHRVFRLMEWAVQRTQSRLEDLEGLILGQWLKWLHPDWEGPNPAPTELGHNLSDLPVFWDWLHEHCALHLAVRGTAWALNCSTCRRDKVPCWALESCYSGWESLQHPLLMIGVASAASFALGLVSCTLEFRFRPEQGAQ